MLPERQGFREKYRSAARMIFSETACGLTLPSDKKRLHLMENMIYNDLIRRGYSVDVGIVELTRIIEGRRRSSQYKIDFVVNVGNDKLYIQSALHVDTPEKKAQETFSLRNTGDFFRKIVVLDGNSKPWTDEDGVMYVGVIPFLLEDIVAEAIG